MKKFIYGKKGITLVELIIAIAIFAVIAAGITAVLTTGLKTYNLNYDSTTGQQSLRVAMIQISKDLRNPANASNVTISGTVLKMNGTPFAVSAGKLSCGSTVYATGIDSITAGYAANSDNKVIQVDLKSTDGGTLSTKISLK